MQDHLLKRTFSLSSSSSDVPRKIQNQECHGDALPACKSYPHMRGQANTKGEKPEYFGQEILTGVRLESAFSTFQSFAQELNYQIAFSLFRRFPFNTGDSPKHTPHSGSYGIHVRSVRTGFNCVLENMGAKCLAGRYLELLARMS